MGPRVGDRHLQAPGPAELGAGGEPHLTGAVGWPAYLVSQLFVAATFVFVYLLGCDLMGPQRAAAGTLLLTGIAYFAWPTPEFNHNVARDAVLGRRSLGAVARGGAPALGWWVLPGALAAGGIYAKLMTGLLFVAAAAWMCSMRARRRRSPRPVRGSASRWSRRRRRRSACG